MGSAPDWTIGDVMLDGQRWLTATGPMPVTLQLRIEIVHGTYAVTAMRIEQRSDTLDPVPVTAEMVRLLPIGALRRAAIAYAQGDLRALSAAVSKPEFRGRGKGVPDDHLRQVADLWASERLVGRAPTAAVAHHWGVARETASKWVRRARNLGYLPEPPGPP